LGDYLKMIELKLSTNYPHYELGFVGLYSCARLVALLVNTLIKPT